MPQWKVTGNRLLIKTVSNLIHLTLAQGKSLERGNQLFKSIVIQTWIGKHLAHISVQVKPGNLIKKLHSIWQMIFLFWNCKLQIRKRETKEVPMEGSVVGDTVGISKNMSQLIGSGRHTTETLCLKWWNHLFIFGCFVWAEKKAI